MNNEQIINFHYPHSFPLLLQKVFAIKCSASTCVLLYFTIIVYILLKKAKVKSFLFPFQHYNLNHLSASTLPLYLRSLIAQQAREFPFIILSVLRSRYTIKKFAISTHDREKVLKGQCNRYKVQVLRARHFIAQYKIIYDCNSCGLYAAWPLVLV